VRQAEGTPDAPRAVGAAPPAGAPARPRVPRPLPQRHDGVLVDRRVHPLRGAAVAGARPPVPRADRRVAAVDRREDGGRPRLAAPRRRARCHRGERRPQLDVRGAARARARRRGARVPGGGAGRGRPGGRGARRAGTARAAAGVRRRLGAVSVAERLAAELFAALDVGLALAEAGDAARAIAALAPAERSLVARAAPERVAAFALGRHAAHAALARLGAPDVPLLAGADRAPCW